MNVQEVIDQIDSEIEAYGKTCTGRIHRIFSKFGLNSQFIIVRDTLDRVAQSVKFWYQRRTRGFDDSCTWNLDTHLAELILPRLKLFRESNVYSWPGEFDDFSTPEEWLSCVDKMIFAFEYICDDERMYGSGWNDAEYDKVKEGLRLFGKYFNALWT